MAGALVQSTTFPWAVSSESKICSKQSGNTVKMMYSSVQTPRMRVGTFSGLQGINMVKRSHDSHSTVVAATSFNLYPPDPIFAGFTERADNALKFARAEARRLGYHCVGPELILLGLLGDETELYYKELSEKLYEILIGKTAKDVLSSMGISLGNARDAVVELLGSGSENGSVEITFTVGADHAFQLAKKECERDGESVIEVEHLLLGLLGVGGGVDFVLRKFGCSKNNIRTQVMSLLVNFESEEDDSDGSFDNNIINLTELAVEKILHPFIGRKPLIEKVIRILGRLTKNNPCLVGEHGVGKTAIADGLAQIIAGGDVPDSLQRKKVITLDVHLLVQEGFVKKLMEKIKQSDDIILFIDDFQTLFGAGAVEGAIGFANILKQALLNSELQCIVATTPDAYQKHMENDPTLRRVFQPVKVLEPTVDETVEILMGIRERYGNHHKVYYTYKALKAAAQLSYQCITDRFLPGKAIDLIDEVGSYVRGKENLVGAFTYEFTYEFILVVEHRVETKEYSRALMNDEYKKIKMLMEQDPIVTKADIEAIVESLN